MFVSLEAGQVGVVFASAEVGFSLLELASGVKDGVQKDGSVGFAAWVVRVSYVVNSRNRRIMRTDLFIVNGFSGLCSVLLRYATELILVKSKLALCANYQCHLVAWRRFIFRDVRLDILLFP